MKQPKDGAYACPRCGGGVEQDDDFCPHCGELFADDVSCTRHPGRAAEGACIVCSKAFCTECGGMVNDHFLCEQHCMVEIYEGMARVFGGSDVPQVEFVKSCLEKEGFHPVIFSRKASPISLGAPDYTLFRASGEFDGHIVNEYKIMVPCQEVLDAEAKLKELDLIK